MQGTLNKVVELFLNDPVAFTTNIALQLLLIRAYCRILEIRAKGLFSLLLMATLALGFLERVVDLDYGTHVSIFGPLTLFVFPVVMSSGPLRTRITKSLLVASAVLASEGIAVALCGLMGINIPPTIALGSGAVSQQDMLVAYISALVFAFLLLEALITIFDDVMDATLSSPALSLLVFSYMLSSATFRRAHLSIETSSLYSTTTMVTTLVTLALCIALVYMTRSGVQASRESANRFARIRQARHIHTEVIGITRRSQAIHRLRHDLANQIGVVSQLASQERFEEADDYLRALIEQSQLIAEGDDE